MTLTAIIVTGFAIDTAFIITDYMKKYIPAVILKTLASLVFVYLGIYCAQLAGGGTYAHLIIAGLAQDGIDQPGRARLFEGAGQLDGLVHRR